MSEGMVLLVLAAVVVVLLVVHRSEGDLGRAVVEYALVGVLATLLAATPATAGMTAGVASGVTTGGQKGAELVGWAWRSTFGRPATAAPPAIAKPARRATAKAKDRPRATKPRSPAATRSPQAPGRPGRAALLGVLGGLALLVLLARRLRRHDLRRADQLAMPLLAGLGRGRHRRGPRRLPA
ncbi:MAG TPA: hypothetical protein VGM21_10720 [Actinomycetota bacterium]|jgi:hypothetical protein